jgi:hypothetical protein
MTCCYACIPDAAHAALSDEIQVYTDDINAPGERGLELHVNTTPRGRKTPDYPGEVVPNHGLRITPEFSVGLTQTWEFGLYVPTNRDAAGNFDVAGAKLRLKWLPIRGDEETGGWFLGANAELSRQNRKFSESPWTSELRIMMGHRGKEWLFAANTFFNWALSPGFRSATPDLKVALKAARIVSESLALGLEYYSDLGTTKRISPFSDQDNTVYLVADFETKSWGLNFGVGRGITSTADKYTVKAILGLPF